MCKTYIANSLEELPKVARQILLDYKDERIFVLNGSMGAGKTTFTKAVCEVLGVKDNVCSPTFAIINEYFSDIVGDIYHFDFYRINKEEEAFDIGLEEYLYSGNYCFMEWSERIINLLPKHFTRITIKEVDNLKREIKIERV
ncbi:MAG: tRNA (adenosine(37)-N6)-threonylcarbamoyltransferase complex ATPase subunit type 1 TsaE [Bacteroidales bacterium]|jgi:tRNA threonylcarbamoyladenosine biosynthesis protein TsaE